jgi:hypothetical protein
MALATLRRVEGRQSEWSISHRPSASLRRRLAARRKLDFAGPLTGLRHTYVRLRDDWGAMKALIKAVFGWIDPHDPCRYLVPNVPGEDIEVSQVCIDQVLREFNPPFRR